MQSDRISRRTIATNRLPADWESWGLTFATATDEPGIAGYIVWPDGSRTVVVSGAACWIGHMWGQS